MMIKITIENNIYSNIQAPQSILNKIWDAFSVTDINHRTKKEYRHSFIKRKDGTFKTGLLSKVKEILNQEGKEFQIIDRSKPDNTKYEMQNLPGFTYHDYQNYIIKKCLKKKRVNIDSSPGTGKTLMMNALIASLWDKKILMLCHDKSIHDKNFTKSKEFFSDDVYFLESKKDKKWKNHRIVYASVQKMSGVDAVDFVNHFGAVMLDESHRLAKQHEDILEVCNAEYRFAFTGTFPSDKAKQLKLIGLFGDVIKGEKREKLEQSGVLSKIKVTLYSPEIKLCESFRYQDIYSECIVNHEQRNRLIIQNSIDRLNKGLTGLILTTRLEHGLNLQKIAKGLGYDFPFVHGGSSVDERLKYLNLLDRGVIFVIIANIWKEGTDIPSLDYVNVAFGEKSDLRLIQTVERCGRGFKGKDRGEAVDYLDLESARYLSGHCVNRLRTYKSKGWL